MSFQFLLLIRAKKIWKVSHANIVDAQDSNGSYLGGNVLIERLSNPEVLTNINALLESKLELLEEWETMALCDILGRSLVKDGQFMPIESVSFKNRLTLNR